MIPLLYIFPEEVLALFTITGIKEIRHAKTNEMTLEVELEEKNASPAAPEEHRGKYIESKGFNISGTTDQQTLLRNLLLPKSKISVGCCEESGTSDFSYFVVKFTSHEYFIPANWL